MTKEGLKVCSHLLQYPPSPFLRLGQRARVYADLPGQFFLRDPEPLSGSGNLFTEVSGRPITWDISQEGNYTRNLGQGCISPFPKPNCVCVHSELLGQLALQQNTVHAYLFEVVTP